MNVRAAVPSDAPAIAAIYNQGIAERQATFETREHDVSAIGRWFDDGRLLLVAERGGAVVAWAGVAPYSDRHYYAGVGEAMLYVERSSRRRGIATELLRSLAAEAHALGLHKLIGKIFTSNRPSIGLVERCGYRAVGTHLRHGLLEGEWRDVLLVETSLGEGSRA